jgi:hypothetical protein
MKFNLINPSDAYHFEAEDLQIAAVMVCILGNGKYGADELGADASESNNVPMFLFGGHDEWFTKTFGMDFEAVATQCLEQRADAMARAFDSVTLTSPPRSSMNNIGGRARSFAEGVRRQAKAVTT